MIRKRGISSLASAVVIGFCVVLRGEEFLLTSLKGILKFWEDTRLKREISHVMITSEEWFKEETG